MKRILKFVAKFLTIIIIFCFFNPKSFSEGIIIGASNNPIDEETAKAYCIDHTEYIYEGTHLKRYIDGPDISIEVPAFITTIGDGAFSNCPALESITIPNTVTSIGDMAFSRCGGLRWVTIPNTVTSIGDNAFDDDYLKYIRIYCNKGSYAETYAKRHGIATTDFVCQDSKKEMILTRYTGRSSSVTIPNTVTSIGDLAFSNCEGLRWVTIPNTVTSIGDNAFDDYALKYIRIYCNKGSYAETYAKKHGIATTDFVYQSSKKGMILTRYIGRSTSITIPNTVISIINNAFYCCTNLKSITIPNTVTFIGDNAFVMCKSLTIHCKKGSYAETYAKKHNYYIKII